MITFLYQANYESMNIMASSFYGLPRKIATTMTDIRWNSACELVDSVDANREGMQVSTGNVTQSIQLLLDFEGLQADAWNMRFGSSELIVYILDFLNYKTLTLDYLTKQHINED